LTLLTRCYTSAMTPTRYAHASTAFLQTLERLDLPDDALADADTQSELGRRAALVAAAELQWRERLGGFLAWSDVAKVLGTVKTRQGIFDLAKRRRLLGLNTKAGHVVYPAFQLAGGRLLPHLPEVLAAFSDADANPWTIASWLVTPQRLLEDATPAEWLTRDGDPKQVLDAAGRLAARLEH
jgi:hypothetical protein